MKQKRKLMLAALAVSMMTVFFAGNETVYATETGVEVVNEEGSTGDDTTETGDWIVNKSVNLTEDTHVTGDLYLESGTLDLLGHTLKIDGNLYQSGGHMYVDGGKLVVGKDYILATKDEFTEMGYSSTNAYIWLHNNGGTVQIKGNFYNYNNGGNNIFAAGTMEIGGDFYQKGESTNFAPTGTKVILNGTGKQIVHFDAYKNNKFNALELINSDVEFTSPVTISNWTLQKNTKLENGLPNEVYGDINLNGYAMTIDGDLSLAGAMNINGGTLVVTGNLYHTDGSMMTISNASTGAGTVKVGGDYILATRTGEEGRYDSTSAWIKMENANDMVTIGGSFYNYHNTSINNVFSAGTMKIGGDFYQKGNRQNFNPTGTKVILNGDESKSQIVHFDEYANNGFKDLELVNPNVEFATAIRGWVLQRGTVFGNGLPNGIYCSEMDLNGHTMTIDGDLSLAGPMK